MKIILMLTNKEELANPATQKNSTKMVTPKWHDEVVQRLEAHEQGSSETYSRTDMNSMLQEHLNALRD